MKTLISFILGIIIGVGVYRYFSRPHNEAATNDSISKNVTRSNGVEKAVRDTLDTDNLKDELDRTGKVIREKAHDATQAITDATVNARTTASIKAKLLKDSGLSAFKIDVDTTDGVVTLSGNVSSIEEIERAISLALETEGVRKVISTLQVKSN